VPDFKRLPRPSHGSDNSESDGLLEI